MSSRLPTALRRTIPGKARSATALLGTPIVAFRPSRNLGWVTWKPDEFRVAKNSAIRPRHITRDESTQAPDMRTNIGSPERGRAQPDPDQDEQSSRENPKETGLEEKGSDRDDSRPNGESRSKDKTMEDVILPRAT